jgi:pre-mRNA-splicing factor 18
MDFASLMNSAISKPKNTDKFVKRSDLESKREEAYKAEQEALNAAKEKKAAAKRRHEEEEAERKAVREEKKRRLAEESKLRREEEERIEEDKRRKRLGLPPLSSKKAIEESKEISDDIDDTELKEKLRELGEPITLFAESHASRLRRYKTLTEIVTDGPIPTTLELLPEEEMAITSIKPPTGEHRKYLFRQLASYFTMILIEWEKALNRRDEEVKSSSQGRAAAAAMEQSRDNLIPLFRKFEKDLEDSILGPIMEIVMAAQKRKYVDANDAYLRLSIGKA